jgi:hypothetical protein
VAKKKEYSEFEDYECCYDDPNAPPIRMQVEAVFRGGRRTPVAIFIVVGGERIAYRGRLGGMPAWISMKDDVVFALSAPGSETLQ